MNYQLFYRTFGHPHHPCILFLHGFMGNVEEFTDVINILKTDFFCLALDLPGHGQTQVVNNINQLYTMPYVATAIIELLNKLNIHQCLLVGYSMGGRLGLYLAVNYPHRFSHIILESASPGLATAAERTARIKSDLGIARRLNRCLNPNDFQQFLINWYQQPIFGQIQHHPHFQKMLAQRLLSQPQELAKSLQYMGTGVQPPLWDSLASLQPQVLLIVGEQDIKFVEINRQMCNFNSNFLLKIMPECGHNIHFEQPILFAEKISKVYNIYNFVLQN